MISIRWTRRKSRSCSTVGNEAPRPRTIWSSGAGPASALRIQHDESVARPGLRVRGLVGGDDGHAEFESLADGLAGWQVGLDAAERRAIVFACRLRRRSDLRGLP